MATHSNVLAWRIPGTGSLVGCRLWGRTELDTTEATQQQVPFIYFCFIFHDSKRWVKEKLAAFYVKVYSAFFP